MSLKKTFSCAAVGPSCRHTASLQESVFEICECELVLDGYTAAARWEVHPGGSFFSHTYVSPTRVFFASFCLILVLVITNHAGLQLKTSTVICLFGSWHVAGVTLSGGLWYLADHLLWEPIADGSVCLQQVWFRIWLPVCVFVGGFTCYSHTNQTSEYFLILLHITRCHIRKIGLNDENVLLTSWIWHRAKHRSIPALIHFTLCSFLLSDSY